MRSFRRDDGKFTVSIDASTIVTMLASAVGVLFVAYSGVLMRRNRTLEEELKGCKDDNKALERENKKYMSVILLASDEAGSISEMRRKVAEMLRDAP